MGTSSVRTDSHSTVNGVKMAVNAPQSVNIPRKWTKPPDSPIEAERQCSEEPNTFGNHMDMLSAQTDTQSIQTDVLTPVNEAANVRTPQIELKSPSLPAGSTTSHSDTTDGFGNCMDMSNACMDVHSIGNDARMAVNVPERIRMRQNASKQLKNAKLTSWTQNRDAQVHL